MNINCRKCNGYRVKLVKKKFPVVLRDKKEREHTLKPVIMVYHCPDCKYDVCHPQEERKLAEMAYKFKNSFFRRLFNVF